MAHRLLIADPKLKKQLSKAAASFGVNSVEELATALADAGYFTIKGPLDVAPVPREAVGAALLEQMTEPYHESFAQLLPAQKQAVILHLFNEGESPHDVARKLWIPIEEAMRTWQRFTDLIGQDVMQIRFESFVGQLHLRVEEIYARAMKAGELKVASETMFKYTKAMQDLGILYRAPTVSLTLSSDEAQAAEAEALRIVELKRKLKLAEVVKDGSDEAAQAPA